MKNIIICRFKYMFFYYLCSVCLIDFDNYENIVNNLLVEYIFEL